MLVGGDKWMDSSSLLLALSGMTESLALYCVRIKLALNIG
jgi:hypothetical protein